MTGYAGDTVQGGKGHTKIEMYHVALHKTLCKTDTMC